MKLVPTEQDFQRYDRHLRIASTVVRESRETIIRKFVTQRVLLVVNPSPTRSPNTRIMLMVAANLIARFCPKVDLAFSDTCPELVADALNLLRRIDTSPHAEFRVVLRQDYPSYAAVLSIGQPRILQANQIVIDGVGWLALLNQTDPVSPLVREEHTSPFGALLAAALGAAEVFKSLLHPPTGTIAHFGSATLSCFDYSLNGTDPGPCLPAHLSLPLSMLGGIGAVGNAFLFALSFIDGLSGDLLVIDKDFVEWTNLNRYLLAFEADADPKHSIVKTQLALRLFNGRALRVHPHQEPLDSVLGKIHRKEVARPEIILSAVDNNDARRTMQNLWPQLILEGATDHTLSQVSRHEHGTLYACLKCIHPKPTRSGNEISYVQHAADLSGIRPDALTLAQQQANLTLSEEHINPDATDEQRHSLRKHVGKTICSILSQLENVSTMPSAKLPDQPAASFVSMTAGLLMAGELVKQAAGWTSALKTLYQLDSFFPLENAFLQPVEKTSTCECVVRRNEIHTYRSAMKRSLSPDVSIMDW